MTFRAEHLEEPLLEFGHNQALEHPKDGLFLYGPIRDAAKPLALRIGAIGTADGLARLRRWLARLNTTILPADADVFHETTFPGFETCFDTMLPAAPLVELRVDAAALEQRIRIANRTERVRKTVALFEQPVRDHLRREEDRPDLWIVVVPEIVHRYGRPQVSGPGRGDRQPSTVLPQRMAVGFLREGALFPELVEQAEIYLFAADFHHQLKAQLLDAQAVLQIARETTLTPEDFVDEQGRSRRRLQDQSSVAWNFATTAFFKAGGRPWRLAGVRQGVCYIGLVFRQDPSPAKAGEACCAAQMFLNSGDGLVFRGALGPWYSPAKAEYHLNRRAAAELMRSVVEQYEAEHGQPPDELFIHGRHRFEDEEWAGFASVVPSATNVVGVRIRPTQDLRLFRPSRMPVLRGTAAVVTRREGYLWTTGFVPRLATYPGFETPKPILVEVIRGNADLLTVMADVLALTKLNYNACEFASGEPVTLKFARRVGEILTASPRVAHAPPLPFRYYI